MRLALGLAAIVLFSGCTSAPQPQEPVGSAYAFVASRVDRDADGLYDAVNVTLIAAPEPLLVSRLAFRVDGAPIEPATAVGGPLWRPGHGAILPCEPGLHEFETWIDGALKKVVVLECGVSAPVRPPRFQARLIDGDSDGTKDGVELTVLDGGPVDPAELNITMGGLQLRLYDTPFKSRLARSHAANGTHLFTPCVPGTGDYFTMWRDQPLATLRLSGCDVYIRGVDAPLFLSALDLDGDRAQDGWGFTLGAPSEGPFARATYFARWGSEPAALNSSITFDPPPDAWATGDTLIATCPGDGVFSFTIYVQYTLVFRSVTPCEEPPGAPLIDLALEPLAGRLSASLVFSRVDIADADELTYRDGSPVGQGRWNVDDTRAIACPGGMLELWFKGRPAFSGPAPC